MADDRTDAAPAPMIVRSIGELRTELAVRRQRAARTASDPANASVGFVPTMGALHDGHLSLVRRARAECAIVVVSLFVNPTQFNESRDLDAYPRDEATDARLIGSVGCDLLFAPASSEIYPPGFGTTIDVGPIALPLEGETRGPVHFRGVATVVAKLLNIVAPDVAYFGQKDAQQTLVIGQLVRDLDIPVRIAICATVREPDGLAMSSRNRRLSPLARERARALFGALRAMQARFDAGEREAQALEAAGRAVLAEHGIVPRDVDYLAVVDLATLARPRRVEAPVLAALAVNVDGVRLIDNVILSP